MMRLGAERDELRVVFDQVGCPTYTGHLAGALVALAGGEDYGIHHIAGRGFCSWFELARTTFEYAGIDCRLEPCTARSIRCRPAGRRTRCWPATAAASCRIGGTGSPPTSPSVATERRPSGAAHT